MVAFWSKMATPPLCGFQGAKKALIDGSLSLDHRQIKRKKGGVLQRTESDALRVDRCVTL